MRIYDVTNWSFDHNQMMQALCAHLRDEINRNRSEIESPHQLEDMTTEWLGEHGKKYKRCNPSGVLILIGKFFNEPKILFRIDYLPSGKFASHPVFWVAFSDDKNGG